MRIKMTNKMTKTLAAVTLAVAMPIGLAANADARPVATRPVANTGFGCTVTPLAPNRVFYHPGFRKSVNYPTSAWCHTGLRVWVQDRQFVRYGWANYPTGSDFWSRTFPTWPHVINRVHWLPRHSRYPIGTYHTVRFSVSNGMSTSGWSSWETSPTTWIWH